MMPGELAAPAPVDHRLRPHHVVIAEVFRAGTRLDEEQSLTI
jgi:hypothetical protein